MNLTDLGWENYIQAFPETTKLSPESVARVAVENKTGYTLFTTYGELTGVLPRAARYKTERASGFPKVGDWVRFEKLPNETKAVITELLPRKTKLSRVGIGHNLDEQIIAANIDKVFIVQGLDANFSLPRFERFLIMVRESGAQPVLVLNKTDLTDDITSYIAQISTLAPNVPIVSMSAATGAGLNGIKQYIHSGDTVVFVGVSGVGKSTIINALLQNNALATSSVRETDSRGRHTTTRKEMIILPSGGVLIDTPGIRELQLDANEEAIANTFADITTLTTQCKFRDCDHEKSQGCAILKAVANGSIPEDRYKRFIKLKREQEHQEKKRDTLGERERKAKHKKIHRDLRKILKHKRG
jgi:ribosome biogenesis GTPase / thiamine phosphate phosphatase